MSCCTCDCSFLETYRNTELFLTLIGTGVHRSVYQLTAHERASNRLLFDMRVEAEVDALLVRGHRSGISADALMAGVAFDHARRIVDAGANGAPVHYRLEVGADTDRLAPAIEWAMKDRREASFSAPEHRISVPRDSVTATRPAAEEPKVIAALCRF